MIVVGAAVCACVSTGTAIAADSAAAVPAAISVVRLGFMGFLLV